MPETLEKYAVRADLSPRTSFLATQIAGRLFSDVGYTGREADPKPSAIIYILTRPDGKMFLQKRNNPTELQIKFPDTWVFPGGFIDPEDNGDTLTAVKREAKEEVGVDLKDHEIAYLLTHEFLPSRHVAVHMCEVGAATAESVSKMTEGDGQQWASVEEIQQIKLGFNQNAFLPQVAAYLKSRGYRSR